MAATIPLIRYPRPEDFEDVIGLAQKECHCSEIDQTGVGDEICQTCGARQVLNCLTTLADMISE